VELLGVNQWRSVDWKKAVIYEADTIRMEPPNTTPTAIFYSDREMLPGGLSVANVRCVYDGLDEAGLYATPVTPRKSVYV